MTQKSLKATQVILLLHDHNQPLNHVQNHRGMRNRTSKASQSSLSTPIQHLFPSRFSRKERGEKCGGSVSLHELPFCASFLFMLAFAFSTTPISVQGIALLMSGQKMKQTWRTFLNTRLLCSTSSLTWLHSEPVYKEWVLFGATNQSPFFRQ